MSQNSLVLPTTGTLSGLAAVQGINNALDTLNTLASGASAPSSPEGGQLWHDTANKQIKIRSIDNTTWIILGTLNETGYTFNAPSAATLSATLGIAGGGTGATTPAAAIAALLGGSPLPASQGGTGLTSVAALYTTSFGQNGYEKSPSGRITQWGLTGTVGGGGSAVNVTFPVAFPNAALNLVVSAYAVAGTNNGVSFTNLNASGFTGLNNSTNENASISWHAEGY